MSDGMRRKLWVLAVAYALLDMIAVGVGMGMPVFAIALGLVVGWVLPALLAELAPDPRRLLRACLGGAALAAAFTCLLMVLLWGPAILLLPGPESRLAQFGIPLILYEPRTSFVAWLVLMMAVAPALQFLTVAVGAAARIAWTPATPLRAVAARWMEAGWQRPDLAALRHLHAADFVDHSPSGRAPDVDGFLAGVAELYGAFPDFHARSDEILIDPARGLVAIRWSAVGTHQGPFLGLAPSGRRVGFRGMEVLRIGRGLVRERWGEWNGLEILAQMQAE